MANYEIITVIRDSHFPGKIRHLFHQRVPYMTDVVSNDMPIPSKEFHQCSWR